MTYKVEFDTEEAEQNVERLEEKAKTAGEKLTSAGDSGRIMGDGIVKGTGEGMKSLDSLGSAAGNAQSSMNNLGGAADSAGKKIHSSFQNAASSSDSMKQSFVKNFNQSEIAGLKFSDNIKKGIVGAVDTGAKKVASFGERVAAGAKKTANKILHPLEAIKSKFTGVMKSASKDTESVGEEAQKSGKDLEKMGSSGEGASNKLASGLKKAMGILAAIAIAAAVVTGIAKFVSSAIEASDAAEQISYSFDKTFGESGTDVNAWSENFAGAVHRNQTEVKNFLTSSKQMADQMGVTGEAGDQLAKTTTALAYDMGSFLKISDDEALDLLQQGLQGNETALSSLGVRLDDTTLKQMSMSMGLGDNLDALDDAALAQIRMNSILEQTTDIQGGASDSIGGFSGGVKSLQGAWTSFMEKAGSKLSPMFDKLFGTILDMWPKIEPQLMGLVELLANGFEQVIPVIADLAETLFPILFDVLGSLMPIFATIGETLLPVFASVLETVGQALQPVMSFVGTLVDVLLPPLAKIFQTLVSTLLPPLASLFGALSPILEGLSPVFDVIASVIGVASDAIATLIGWLGKAIDKIGEFAGWVGDKLGGIGDFFGGIGESIGGLFGGGGSGSKASNASGTNDFEGGWTNIHEAGDELVVAKHGSGMAFLPKGSAILPASATKELLDPKPQRTGLVKQGPMLPENQSFLESIGPGISNFAQDPMSTVLNVGEKIANSSAVEKIGNVLDITNLLPPRADDNDPDGNPPPPHWWPVDTGGSGTTKSISNPPNNDDNSVTVKREITIIIKLEGDGKLSPAAEEKFIETMEDVAREVFQEEKENEDTKMEIQQGYAG